MKETGQYLGKTTTSPQVPGNFLTCFKQDFNHAGSGEREREQPLSLEYRVNSRITLGKSLRFYCNFFEHLIMEINILKCKSGGGGIKLLKPPLVSATEAGWYPWTQYERGAVSIGRTVQYSICAPTRWPARRAQYKHDLHSAQAHDYLDFYTCFWCVRSMYRTLIPWHLRYIVI